jgi:hypothetical protein
MADMEVKKTTTEHAAVWFAAGHDDASVPRDWIIPAARTWPVWVFLSDITGPPLSPCITAMAPCVTWAASIATKYPVSVIEIDGHIGVQDGDIAVLAGISAFGAHQIILVCRYDRGAGIQGSRIRV